MKRALITSVRSSARRVHRDQRGAALVEFLVAFMPLMITFTSFVQLSQIATANIVVKHSAIVGARAASVISNAHKNTPDQADGDNRAEIESGVKLAMGPWEKTMRSVKVDVDDQSSCNDPYGMVTVTVNADYRCSVPLGGRIVCGIVGGGHPIVQKFGFPHEGARYQEGGGAKCD